MIRRNFSAILLLFVFLSLQFGKVATYLYCKVQAEIVQNKPDCGCEDHLISMFGHKDDNPSKGDLAKNITTEKLNEFTPKSSINIPEISFAPAKCFTEYNAALSESFFDAPFHPPIA